MIPNQKDFLIIGLFILVGIGLWAWVAWVIYFSIPEAEEKEVRLEKCFVKGMNNPSNKIETIKAEITAYSPQETCPTGECRMASGKVVYEGAVACGRDIPLGSVIEIGGKDYICEDRLARQYDDRIDIFMEDYWMALNFGRQIKEITIFYQ